MPVCVKVSYCLQWNLYEKMKICKYTITHRIWKWILFWLWQAMICVDVNTKKRGKFAELFLAKFVRARIELIYSVKHFRYVRIEFAQHVFCQFEVTCLWQEQTVSRYRDVLSNRYKYSIFLQLNFDHSRKSRPKTSDDNSRIFFHRNCALNEMKILL